MLPTDLLPGQLLETEGHYCSIPDIVTGSNGGNVMTRLNGWDTAVDAPPVSGAKIQLASINRYRLFLH